MKKGGKLSLIVYIIYTLLGVGLAIYSKVAIDSSETTGWEGLGLVVVFIIGLILGGAGLIATVIKLIHMKSGWLLFGLLAIAADLVMIAAFISTAIPQGGISAINLEDLLHVLPFVAVSAASLVANIKSLKD